MVYKIYKTDCEARLDFVNWWFFWCAWRTSQHNNHSV